MRILLVVVMGIFTLAASDRTDNRITKDQEKEIIQIIEMLENMELIESLQFYEYMDSVGDSVLNLKTDKSESRRGND